MKSKKSNPAPEIDASILEARNVKERITTLVDFDVLKWLREAASEKGVPYQTFLNSLLRAAMDEAVLDGAKRTGFEMGFSAGRTTMTMEDIRLAIANYARRKPRASRSAKGKKKAMHILPQIERAIGKRK